MVLTFCKQCEPCHKSVNGPGIDQFPSILSLLNKTIIAFISMHMLVSLAFGKLEYTTTSYTSRTKLLNMQLAMTYFNDWGTQRQP